MKWNTVRSVKLLTAQRHLNYSDCGMNSKYKPGSGIVILVGILKGRRRWEI